MILYFQCPHCDNLFEVLDSEINCGIFRHAAFKNGEPVSPHAPKEHLDHWSELGLLNGCGKPFRIQVQKDTSGGADYKIEPCDYSL